MSEIWLTTIEWFPLIVYAMGAGILAWQDSNELSVSQSVLYGVLGSWIVVGLFLLRGIEAAPLSAAVLTAGALFLYFAPEALGEADVLFMAGLAWLLPFWSFLFSIGLGCVFGFATYLVYSCGGTRSPGPVPFLPSLGLGGLVVLGSNL